jgi:hypothetical protein
VTGAGRFDGGVQSENIGLKGDLFDGFQDLRDLGVDGGDTCIDPIISPRIVLALPILRSTSETSRAAAAVLSVLRRVRSAGCIRAPINVGPEPRLDLRNVCLRAPVWRASREDEFPAVPSLGSRLDDACDLGAVQSFI